MENMEKWRFLDLEFPTKAAMNLAVEEAIFQEKVRRNISSTIRFWRNKNAVIIGFSQNLKNEVNLKKCNERNVEIIRRFSGGGAVYHDLGNLNYSITIDATHPLVNDCDITSSYLILSSGIVKCLETFGVKADFNPTSTILVKGKKISGTAQSRKKNIIFHHGTLLVDSDLNLLYQVLKPTTNELRNKRITSKKVTVTNLVYEVDYPVKMKKVKESLRKGFEKAFSIKLIKDHLTLKEKNLSHMLYKTKYSNATWNFWR
jgi:lipoate-protein ligase A